MAKEGGWRARASRSISTGLERLARPIWLNDRAALVADKVGLTAAYRFVQRRVHPPHIRDITVDGEVFRFWIVTPEETYTNAEAEDHSTPALAAMLAPGQTVLDVGGHHGVYTLLSAKRVGPQGTVLAFEPDPAHNEVLRKNVELNGFANVRVVQAAVGASQGTVRFAHNRVHGSRRAKEVPLTTLDSVVASHGLTRVDVVKIDVEGHELEVLKGATSTLKMRPKVLVELHPALLAERGQAATEPLELLQRAGYRLSYMAGSPARRVPYTGQPIDPAELYEFVAEPA